MTIYNSPTSRTTAQPIPPPWGEVRRGLFLLLLLIFALLPLSADRVEPLLGHWVRHQLAPFNSALPAWRGSDGTLYRPPKVGCVATALETIVSYHGRNITLADSLAGWTTPNYSLPTLPAGTTVRVDRILPRYDEGRYSQAQVDAVAQLSLICGMMAQMHYGLEESGAQPARLVEPLGRIFRWRSVALVDSYDYDPRDWIELLKNELRAGRPVFYTGYTMNLFGHAFVLDGFDDDDRFHFNFGFGGAYDAGWFRLDEFAVFQRPSDITPAGIAQGFVANHTALLLHPDSVDFALPHKLARTGREIAVDEFRPLATPEVGIYTPIALTLRNTSDRPLTTPFALFTNLPTDTLLFAQADYGALYGMTLNPGESRSVVVQARFDHEGERLLRLSPDDSTLIAERPVAVAPHAGHRLEFGDVQLQWVDSTTARVSLPISNAGPARSGDLVTFCLMPDTALVNEGDFRHYAYATLEPGESDRFTATFAHLTPGATHRLVVRAPWTVQASLLLTVPAAPTSLPRFRRTDAEVRYYDLSGRRVVQPERGQIYISAERGEKRVE
ncbi:MAG: C10 family peptidase [Bacteroidaceae bacterium]|nr:C10 family peptidase [Bacteroidaceae bacterium]